MSQINVNNIRAKDGVSAVGFPGGINATGVVTATTFKGALEGNVTGNVTGSSGSASGLTGTPNITVGTVTGTDATFSGNLTVNGTTTTIDTAVTAVDSLAVDGNITALGRLGIGTDNPGHSLEIKGNFPDLVISDSDTANDKFRILHNGGGTQLSVDPNNVGPNPSYLLVQIDGTEVVRFDSHRTTKFKGPLTEKFHNHNSALTGDYNHDLITHGNVYWSVSNSSGPFTFNLRGSASVSLDSMMSDGESLSFLLTHSTNNASNYMTAFKVDGNTLINGTHIWWSGGTAPSAAGTSGYDVYSFTLYKIGSASFRAFASLTNHA